MRTVSGIAACLIAGALLSPPSPSHAAPDPGGALTIEHYKLANGLEVVLQPDPTLSTAVVHVWYHVGSKDEVLGKSGFAHLFEHLMFEGSKHVKEGEFDRLLEEAGGWNNGTTNNDRTNYFEQVPVSHLPLALWLEADRLGGLWEAMSPALLTNQRDIVKNERRQSIENRPYGKVELEIQQALWPKGHGNWNLTIGTMEDLDAASMEDVEAFWRTYYRPSNATLVIVGGFDVGKTKALIEKLFAWMPNQPVPRRRTLTAPVVPLPRPRTIETTDKVQVPKVIIAMRAPEAYSQASFDLTIASYLLGAGKTSRLYKRLVFQDRIATEASAYLNDQMLGSELAISAVARPGVTAQQVRAVLEEEVQRMVKEPPTAADIERARRVIEVGLLSSLENPASRAGRLAEWAAYTGDPDHLAETRAALAKVTPESCAKAIRDWVSLDHAVTAIVMPEGGAR
jgi:zinc protease